MTLEFDGGERCSKCQSEKECAAVRQRQDAKGQSGRPPARLGGDGRLLLSTASPKSCGLDLAPLFTILTRDLRLKLNGHGDKYRLRSLACELKRQGNSEQGGSNGYDLTSSSTIQ